MNFTDLLENYIILKERNRELYYDIKDNIDYYKEFINDILSYDLIIKDDFIKLEKIPTTPESWMGIRSFNNKKDYIFFLLLLMYLEDKNKEDCFILSGITEYIKHNFPNEDIDWTNFQNRKSLISVLKFSLDLGVIKKNDGDEDEFIKSEYGEVLYESTGISKYIVRRFSKNIHSSENYIDLLNDAWEGISTDKGIIRKNRVFRKLLLCPIIYNENKTDSDYEYIKNYRSYIKNIFEKYLQWDVHIHKNGALVVLKNQGVIKDTFPNKKGESNICLFISNKIRLLIAENKLNVNEKDIIVITEKEFNKIILDVREEYGHGFIKTFRDNNEDYFLNNLKSFLKEYSMIKINQEFVEIMPLLGKIVGEYPKDYKGESS